MSNGIKTEARFFVKEIDVTLFVWQYEERGVKALTCKAFFCGQFWLIGMACAEIRVRARSREMSFVTPNVIDETVVGNVIEKCREPRGGSIATA